MEEPQDPNNERGEATVQGVDEAEGSSALGDVSVEGRSYEKHKAPAPPAPGALPIQLASPIQVAPPIRPIPPANGLKKLAV